MPASDYRGENLLMYYAPADKKLIENRALEIHLIEQIPLPIARSEAMAEWERMQKKPKAEVVAIGQARLSARNSTKAK